MKNEKTNWSMRDSVVRVLWHYKTEWYAVVLLCLSRFIIYITTQVKHTNKKDFGVFYFFPQNLESRFDTKIINELTKVYSDLKTRKEQSFQTLEKQYFSYGCTLKFKFDLL